MQATNSKRNATADILRGIAMLMVILGHTLTGVARNAEDTVFFNVIWSLQMPLFMLISGYVSRYSKTATTGKQLLAQLGKKTMAYILPWAVWTFLIRGVLFGETRFFDLKQLLWHMDQGYWFLVSLFMIVCALILTKFLVHKMKMDKKPFSEFIVTSLIYLVAMALFAAVGLYMGLSFLGIKLTLYYMPFFYLGYLFGAHGEKVFSLKHGGFIKEVGIAASALGWIFLLNRYNFFTIGDDVFGILIRAFASLLGCIAVCGIVSAFHFTENSRVQKALAYVGTHSLKYYLAHYLLLSLFVPNVKPLLFTPTGIGLVGLNFLVTVLLTTAVTILVQRNKALNTILFSKSK